MAEKSKSRVVVYGAIGAGLAGLTCLGCCVGSALVGEPAPMADEGEVEAPSDPMLGVERYRFPDSGPQAVETQAGEPHPPTTDSDSPWEDDNLVDIGIECPEGIWALVPRYTPGRDRFDQREREAEREGLADRFGGRRFRGRLGRHAVELGEYDFRRQRYPVTVDVDFHCRPEQSAPGVAGPSANRINFALGRARVDVSRERMGGSAHVERTWVTPPHRTFLPIDEERAPSLIRAEGTGLLDTLRGPPPLIAEVIFEFARGRVDNHMERDSLGERDIGAGPLIEGRLVALRIINDRTDEIMMDSTDE